MDIFVMGEYGTYVWSSYLLTLIVVVVCVIQGRRRHQMIADTVKRQLKLKEVGE